MKEFERGDCRMGRQRGVLVEEEVAAVVVGEGEKDALL